MNGGLDIKIPPMTNRTARPLSTIIRAIVKDRAQAARYRRSVR
jgi:hypothetical protein